LEAVAMKSLCAILTASLLTAAFLLPAQSQQPAKAKVKEVANSRTREETLRIMRLLDTPMETKDLQVRVKFKTALEHLMDRMGGKPAILVDREAFVQALGADAPDIFEEEVVLPPTPTKMPIGTALQLLIRQVARGEGTFLIRKGWIEIVPQTSATPAVLLQRPNILAAYEQRPLQEIIQDLSDESGLSIDMDPALADKAAMPITVMFRNCTVEDALVRVTEMAQLKYAVLNNSVFVTTADRAKQLQKEEETRKKKREEIVPMGGA
jgi:hypothetical protein